MPGTVDIHSHLYPRWYVDALKRRTTPPRVVGDPGAERFVIFDGEHGRPMGEEYWDLDAKLAFMASHGIVQTVASLGNPWLDPFDGDEAAELAIAANEYFASLEGLTEGRIVGMGVLPQHDVDQAALTVAEIAGTPTLYGAINGCRLCGRELDDPELEPVWTALEATGLPLLLHPHYLVGREQLTGWGHAFPVALGFTFETTVAVSRLIFAGVLERHPGLRLVASHGGGTLPFLGGRLDAGWRSDPSVREALTSPPTNDLRKIFFDALVYHAPAVLAVRELVGVDQMAFGSDHPFSVADPVANLDAIDEALAPDERDAVLTGSARRFFDLPKLDHHDQEQGR
ncbi:MAG TPA: amidohydrolase family protein [Baekduia sp.]|uniref:amidohydrolase family protein n=1 Tax=Baekduia sp. TaxID=2600305 RepID=UPI002B6DFF0A|nr:amidohydrolase family protein [Baekduia sp.]HMJ35606.1 amidohydrolase family protein [Baekduia sp.]